MDERRPCGHLHQGAARRLAGLAVPRKRVDDSVLPDVMSDRSGEVFLTRLFYGG